MVTLLAENFIGLGCCCTGWCASQRCRVQNPPHESPQWEDPQGNLLWELQTALWTPWSCWDVHEEGMHPAPTLPSWACIVCLQIWLIVMLVKLLQELEVEKFITHSVPFSEINKAFEYMLQGIGLRCIIKMDAWSCNLPRYLAWEIKRESFILCKNKCLTST